MKRENYAAAKKLIAASKRILVSGHLSPDGDSLGSMLALARLLRNAGKEAFATADLNALGKPGFLEGVKDLIPVRKLKRQMKFDLFIAVDCASFERMPPEVRPVAEKLPKLCIDHHVTNDGSFADVSIVDPEASSTGEIIWRIAKWNEWKLDTAIAEALWVAIVTDSGRFAYDSTKPGTMRAAGDLLKHGVRTAFINDVIYGSGGRDVAFYDTKNWGMDTIAATTGTMAVVFGNGIASGNVKQTYDSAAKTMTLTRQTLAGVAAQGQSIVISGWSDETHSIVFGGSMAKVSAWTAAASPTAAVQDAARKEIWTKAGLLAG